ncbi:MAG: pectate lyase, partial [Duncaniella sp.]|nr:pectate lyase [Duncaniella sp.]
MSSGIVKNCFIAAVFMTTVVFNCIGADLASLPWAQICTGKMGTEWYASDEATAIADKLLLIQKNTGGWPKNYEFHLLSDAEIQALSMERAERSCLDNNATTQEMQFLARVYAGSGTEQYRQAFERGLRMILNAQKTNGGWSQYWPIFGDGRYHDFITFNDNLMTNVLRLLQNVASNRDIYTGIVDASVRDECSEAYDRGIELVINCQVDDNGIPSAWCAQHHNSSLIPVEGRPFELPSISGYESVALLSYLMTIDCPSAALQNTIRTAVAWLDEHKITDKALEKYTNADGLSDYRIVDKPGSNLWARFIQLGGDTGEAIYKDFFERLRLRGKTRSYTWEGKKYTYSEYELASSSYDPDRAYQPVFSIYDNLYPHLFYRFLYNYEDSAPEPDQKGVPVPTSIGIGQRTGYQFMGNWGEKLINSEYPAWEQRMLSLADADDHNLHLLSAGTYIASDTDGSSVSYRFPDGISISNSRSKLYAEGLSYTRAIKYSPNIEYTITLPPGMKVSRIRFTGYNNYSDADAYISRCNGKYYPTSDYTFPPKDESGKET